VGNCEGRPVHADNEGASAIGIAGSPTKSDLSESEQEDSAGRLSGGDRGRI